MKCCNEYLNVRFLNQYHIVTFQCYKCHKYQDIRIPKHIPTKQYYQYATKKYKEINKEQEILINSITEKMK